MLLRGGRRDVLVGAPTVADTVGEGVEDDMVTGSDNDRFAICPTRINDQVANTSFCCASSNKEVIVCE